MQYWFDKNAVKPKFEFMDTCKVHDIIGGIKQDAHDSCLIYGMRYVNHGGKWCWAYYVICNRNPEHYQWIREENLSLVD